MTVPTERADVACVLCVGQSTFGHVLFVSTAVTAGLKYADHRAALEAIAAE